MAALQDHARRYELTNELHARPFALVQAPGQAMFLAVKQPERAVGRDRDADIAHLIRLLDHYGAPHPKPGATHYTGALGRVQLRWESHTEFVTYTLYAEGAPVRAFSPEDAPGFPEEWLAEMPGQCIASALFHVAPRPKPEVLRENLRDWFVAESLAISDVLDGAATIAGDFRIDAAGHQRFAIFVDEQTGPARVGRIMQRLCEIELYHIASMLGFARAQGLGARMNEIDRDLTDLISRMAGETAGPEEMLGALLGLSSELEGMAAQNAFRFDATTAYEAIVTQRIAVLRERRFEGRQSFAEFMMRRYDPAMRTVAATRARLDGLGARALRAAELLRTRVEVSRSAQNQELLASMDRRADTALRLQNTVEGLSVVAISYYAVSLMGYLLAPLAKGAGIEKTWVLGAATLPVCLAVWWAIRRLRARLH